MDSVERLHVFSKKQMNIDSDVRVMSFADIVQGRDASVRVTNDGLIHAVDLIVVMTGQDKNHASQVM
jgi:hypothetical protein